MGATGFAVFDLETTGLWPSYGHRVVEIGIVLLDSEGNFEGNWETLINPQRDLGPTHIHGIKGSDVRDAGVFADYAPQILELMQGRVLVAHNAKFDVEFLNSEFDKIGISIPVRSGDDAICTMSLGSKVLPGRPRSLAACCEAVGVENQDAHAALADAKATAEVFKVIMDSCLSPETITNILEIGSELAWPELTQTNRAVCSREDVHRVPQGDLAEYGAKSRPRVVTAGENSFIALLDNVLEDAIVTVQESQELLDAATALGLSRERLQELRTEYFSRMVELAWADDRLTDSERASIQSVGEWMGIDGATISAALASPPLKAATGLSAIQIPEGGAIVLTGEMAKPRSYYEDILVAKGFRVASSVSKKVSVLLVADPDSLSTKARKARELGIPIFEVDEFLLQVA